MHENPTPPTDTSVAMPESVNAEQSASDPAPQTWEAFLEDDADCCGGCNHKPR